MTIYSSLTAGVAGLLTNAHRLGSISDNIANSSTQGYKRADTDFHSLVNKGLGGEYSAGGVRATTQRLVGENGAYTNTKNATDIAVRGRGLLPVTTRSAVTQGDHTDNLLLTTTGSFRTDSEGYLTSTSGLVLMG
jgi:flagellar hook protein FlgE